MQSAYLDSIKNFKLNHGGLLHDPKKYIDDNFRKDYFKKKKINKIGVSVYTEKEILEILKIAKPDIINYQ